MATHVVTACIGGRNYPYFERFWKHFEPRQRAYAERWGMSYEVWTQVRDFSKEHAKLYWCQDIIMSEKLASVPDGDTVIWLDGDVLPVRGDLELRTDRSFAAAPDQPMAGIRLRFSDINAGVMVVRNNAWTRDLFERVWRHQDVDQFPWAPNEALNRELAKASREELLEHLQVLPRSFNVTLDQHAKGSFPESLARFRHFAGNEHVAQRWLDSRLSFDPLPITPPPYGRREGFDILKDLVTRMAWPQVLEIGTIRIPNNWHGDGWSTTFFAWLAELTGGELWAVDIDPNAVDLARRTVDQCGLNRGQVHIAQADALEIATLWNSPLDVLYLDAMDPDKPGAAEAHLRLLEGLDCMMRPGSLLVFDDIHHPEPPYEGKGRLAIPWALGHRYETVHTGYTFIMRKK